MIDKNYCMSSYLAFRYIEKDDMDFYETTRHKNIKLIRDSELTGVSSAEEIDMALKKVFKSLRGQKIGIMLSGGMDSACLASYMEGCDAYTFRFLNGDFKKNETDRAKFYADYYKLRLHYVDINWDTVTKNLKPVMVAKGAPVHSIEPQLYQAALQAKMDGVERLIVGESADLLFGGMDKLLAEEWDFDTFIKRYIFTDPEKVLKNPEDMSYLFERYREGNKIDYLTFMDNVFAIESSSSYLNAFGAAEMPYTDPYAGLKMVEELDLNRVRNGEPKYLIRELFALKYPGYLIPDKVPMPRPVDNYFKNWQGPRRKEFINSLNMNEFTGDQKWQIYCLEEFLNLYEPEI